MFMPLTNDCAAIQESWPTKIGRSNLANKSWPTKKVGQHL